MSESNFDELARDLKPVLELSSPNTSCGEFLIDSDCVEGDAECEADGNNTNGEAAIQEEIRVETFTLSSDDDDDACGNDGLGVNDDASSSVECNSRVTIKNEFQSVPEQISSLIDNLIRDYSTESFDERCQKLKDSLESCNKEVENVFIQCIELKEECDKFAARETHITTEGVINPSNNLLSVHEESVQRIVEIDPVRRKVCKEISNSEIDTKEINLGKLSAITQFPDIDVVKTQSGAESQAIHKLPKVGPIVRKPSGIGDPVFAVSNPDKMAFSTWQPATIFEMIKVQGKIQFNVTYTDSFKPSVLLRGFQIAYSSTPDVMLQNKTRVIAYYSPDYGQFVKPVKPSLFSGLIAEVAKAANSFRYLVFFDNGASAYVKCDSVFLVAEESSNIFEGIPEERKLFLQKYFKDYPERAMVKYQVGTKDYVLIGDKWVPGKVKQLDHSLALFYFRNRDKYEWIYRGSPRLKPLSRLLRPAKPTFGKNSVRATRKGTSSLLPYKNRYKPFVQYTRDDEMDENFRRSPKSGTRTRAVQRKEFELFPRLFNPPNRKIISNSFTNHLCSKKCINLSLEDISKFRDINPYAVPVICGWDRQICSTSGKKKGVVFYIAPCGRRLRNIAEVDRYLMLTESGLPIDVFTFHHKLKLYSEYEGGLNQGCYYYEPDVTQGTENHSISCINWLTSDPITPHFQYYAERFPGRGIKLETDPNFLECCSCTDGCRDKTKCECQQLTSEAHEIIRALLGYEEEEVGYCFRRLSQSLQTGLWECNSNCSCSANCANRVVQHGIRVLLQIFRTEHKGWGIRCLHDIPPGAFIAIYAAEILDEDLADEYGGKFGDEYLADLDYIETMEALKEGYEQAEAEMSSSEDEQDDAVNSPVSDQEYEYYSQDYCETKKSKDKQASKKAKKEKPVKSKLKSQGIPFRELFGERSAYILDAKRKGNVGRYFNHSCEPNCYVQNVFIDSHDLRFPWVALFSQKFIPAFTELNWDYNYEIIEDRPLLCRCGAAKCRLRLL